ncbi:uncharacterized protein LOC106879401 [Octopus bimaculoides]|uniref:Uncharacterized protein n=1 Tax=Octopus bimaculoides TaxID=37653 RepID=A0A0L8G4S2_OCTBM|nr:uncharacterized protein LOC106879401 [Octopus bimaculoides]|eukprot:XP_014784430.1 PREDICTED: uncharacterized protein LOC106879401 [Octopus bimaculoides]
MAIRVTMPVITRKKTVPSKHNPNTFRVVCYNEDSHVRKYPDTSPALRAQDPLGICGNKRPNILSYATRVLSLPLYDYRGNIPYHKNSGFLRQNYHMLNKPVCYMETEGQPEGHWISPTLHQEKFPQPPYRYDTISRRDYSSFSLPANGKVKKDKMKPYKLKAPWDKTDGSLSEKISYEHCYDCRKKTNYPIRGKRHGAFTWKVLPKEISENQEQKKQPIFFTDESCKITVEEDTVHKPIYFH